MCFLAVFASYCVFAQDTDSTGAKTKMKMKTDDGGKMKVKSRNNNGDMNNNVTTDNNNSSTSGDDSGNRKSKRKLKNKDNGDMNNSSTSTGAGMNTTTTTTTTTVMSTDIQTKNPASLPVVYGYVPDNVVSTIKTHYGTTTVYDIKPIKGNNGQDIYVVRLWDNGTYRTDYVGADGNVVAH